ncbi:helix-turn-helix transcriptional regulator [Dysosmobacter sp.]|uniref:helix-turn-helix domain-containing protein n=1 Tax=Dysosmobacter sp. TaxID=2591382 RepID=UPI00307C7322
MTLTNLIAARINQLRKSRKLSVNKVATMSGLPYSTVNSLLRGKSDSPNLKTLIRIATAFNMTIVEFLNVPEIIEFSEDDLEDESEKNEGQEETNKALREVVHRGE